MKDWIFSNLTSLHMSSPFIICQNLTKYPVCESELPSKHVKHFMRHISILYLMLLLLNTEHEIEYDTHLVLFTCHVMLFTLFTRIALKYSSLQLFFRRNDIIKF